MITETREIYKCEHCRRMYQRKFWAEYHENRCKHNPVNIRPCFTCPFSKKVEIETDEYSETMYKRDIIYCEKKNIGICPPFQSGYSYVTLNGEEILNDNMPVQCDIYNKLSVDQLIKLLT